MSLKTFPYSQLIGLIFFFFPYAQLPKQDIGKLSSSGYVLLTGILTSVSTYSVHVHGIFGKLFSNPG